jgi:hypothetical protein
MRHCESPLARSHETPRVNYCLLSKAFHPKPDSLNKNYPLLSSDRNVSISFTFKVFTFGASLFLLSAAQRIAELDWTGLEKAISRNEIVLVNFYDNADIG